MEKIILLLLNIVLCYVETLPAPAPQDFQTAALMLAGQLKDIIDNGAVARDETKFEFMGAKVSNNMAMGFGDLMKIPGGRRRREIDTHAIGAGNSMSYEGDYASSEYSYESGELGWSKFVGKGEERERRDVAGSSSSQSSFSSDSSSSYSSSSSSGESDES